MFDVKCLSPPGLNEHTIGCELVYAQHPCILEHIGDPFVIPATFSRDDSQHFILDELKRLHYARSTVVVAETNEFRSYYRKAISES